MPTVAELSAQVAELREAVVVLTERLDAVRVIKQRRPQPVGEPCNLDNDPETCAKASVYHYQKGCKGQACLDKNSAYYAENRDAKAAAAKKAAQSKKAPAKKAAPVAKKAAPTKRVAKK